MFVHIKRGDVRLYVPQKAFLSKYAPVGYTLDDGADDDRTDAQMSFGSVSDVTPDTGMVMPKMTAEDEYEPNTEDDDTEEENELEETPLSEMTFPQLQQYARMHGISANGYNNKKALREAIKEIMNK